MTIVNEDAKALSISAFCSSYGISRSLCYQLIASGRLKARKAGHRTLILQTDADQWAASLPHLISRGQGGA